VIKAHKYSKKIALFPLNRGVASMGTRTHPFTKLGVQAEQMILFSWFRAALHPLALGHELDTLVHFRNEYDFRFFFNLNDFLPTIL
jgi:hypothetical protein